MGEDVTGEVDQKSGGGEARASRRPLRSTELLGAAKEVVIVHDGAEYILRITSKNKLILTK